MFAKIVEWSEDQQCYVGSAPELIYGGWHGPAEVAVFDQLCQVVEDAVALYRLDGKSLPPRPRGAISRTSCKPSPAPRCPHIAGRISRNRLRCEGSPARQ